jgi:hypothetical protein
MTNIDGQSLTVDNVFLQGSADFAVLLTPPPPIVISPGVTVDIEIAFIPSSIGYVTANLQIESSDPGSPVITVSLGGVGVSQQPPPTSVADILAFFDASVANGSLVGYGPGKSAEGRKNALRNMIEAAGDLIDDGNTTKACQQLQDAYLRTDGSSRPPEFVAGPAAPTLAQMIFDLKTSL